MASASLTTIVYTLAVLNIFHWVNSIMLVRTDSAWLTEVFKGRQVCGEIQSPDINYEGRLWFEVDEQHGGRRILYTKQGR